jgi:hypothetical protein
VYFHETSRPQGASSISSAIQRGDGPVRKSWASGLIAAALCLSLFAETGEIHAAEQQVRITLPTFPVSLNGVEVNNENREYPLIVYKDITYFPMTWYDSRLLGLETEWSAEQGLSIHKANNVSSSYEPYPIDGRNKSSVYFAAVPSSNIAINGQSIHNTGEEYPLLSFRDVTYFPLTWKYAHDRFGWDYQWDATEGLAITSVNPQFSNVQLPSEASKNDVALFNGYYYFALTNDGINEIYRAPVEHPSDRELLYTYGIESPYGSQPWLSFMIRGDELWFKYHTGGATMGSDRFVRIDEAGHASEIYSGYLDFVGTTEGTLVIDLGVPPSGNNLKLVPHGEQDRWNGRSIGDSNLIYERYITFSDSSTGYSTGNGGATVIGDHAYVLASSYPPVSGNVNQLYRIHLSTNETTRIVDSEVRHYKIINHKLYYVKEEDNTLYSSELDGSNENKLSYLGQSISHWYDELNGSLFYTLNTSDGKYQLYKFDNSEADTLILSEPIESVQTSDGLLICKLPTDADYGVKLFDSEGKLVLAITDQVSRIFIHEGSMLLVTAKDHSIKQISLKSL